MVYGTYGLIRYVKRVGVTYKTAYRWWKDGKLEAYQSHTGTIIVREQADLPTGVALYRRAACVKQAIEQCMDVADEDATRGQD